MARFPATRRNEHEDEDDLAKAVASFLRVAWPEELPWWHTPNGGSRAKVQRTDRRTGKTYSYSPEAAKLKAMGTLAGVPDLTFIMPNGQAAFIELKVGDNTLSDEQADLRALLMRLGCGYETARSLERVETILGNWLRVMNGAGFRRADGSEWSLRGSLVLRSNAA